MKTKEVKREEAVARNERHRAKYEHDAKEAGLTGDKATEYVNMRIGIPKVRKQATPVL
jgi:hypothetical protein